MTNDPSRNGSMRVKRTVQPSAFTSSSSTAAPPISCRYSRSNHKGMPRISRTRVCISAAAHRRENVEGIFCLNHGLHALVQITRIASVHEDVDVRVELAVVVQHLAAHGRETRDNGGDELVHSNAVIDIEVDRLAADDGPVRGVEIDLHPPCPSLAL